MNLGQVLLRFQHRNTRTLQLVNDALPMLGHHPHHAYALIGLAIIKLHDEWSTRCREIIIHSAEGGVVSRTGRRITRSVFWQPYGSPIAFLRHAWGLNPMGNNWEPPWYIPGQAIRAAQLLGVVNLVEIQNGLGATVSADDLRITRNLVAHNLPNTWRQFQGMHRRNGIGSRIKPEDFVISRRAAVGARFIEDWAQDLENSLAAAAI